MSIMQMASSQNDPRNTQVLALLKNKNLRVSFVAWLKKIGGDANLAGLLSKLPSTQKNRALDTLVEKLNESPVHVTGAELPDDHVFNMTLEDLAGAPPMDEPTPPPTQPEIANPRAALDALGVGTEPEEVVVDESQFGRGPQDQTKDTFTDDGNPALGPGFPDVRDRIEVQAEVPVPGLDDTMVQDDLEGFRAHLKETRERIEVGFPDVRDRIEVEALRINKINDRLSGVAEKLTEVRDHQKDNLESAKELEEMLKNLPAEYSEMKDRLDKQEANLQHTINGEVDIAAITAGITHAVLDEVRRIAVTTGDLEVLINLINNKK